jgi:hypothetical protein
MTSIVDRLHALIRVPVQFDLDLRQTYFALRMGAGLLGLFLPLVLVGWGLTHEVPWNRMGSLSAFYWLSQSPPADSNALLRNWFVGSLVAVGMCLVVYAGYGRLENWLLNFAGLAAAAVAFNPMPWPQLHEDALHIHYTAAVVFFLLIAATIWFCARDTLAAIASAKVRARWGSTYKVFAIAMLVMPLAGYLLAARDHQTIWIEALGVWVFSAYWFAKTYELSHVSMIEPTKGPAPRVSRVNGVLEVVRAAANQPAPSDPSPIRAVRPHSPP